MKTTLSVLKNKYFLTILALSVWVVFFDKNDLRTQIDLRSDVKQLQEELRKAKLHNKLLNAIIDIAEEQLKIDIRKKSGTKQ